MCDADAAAGFLHASLSPVAAAFSLIRNSLSQFACLKASSSFEQGERFSPRCGHARLTSRDFVDRCSFASDIRCHPLVSRGNRAPTCLKVRARSIESEPKSCFYCCDIFTACVKFTSEGHFAFAIASESDMHKNEAGKEGERLREGEGE